MGKRTSKYYAIATIALIAASCSKVPDYVIPPDKMASLMADIHIGESVVDLNRMDYPTDSDRMLMKQSVLIKHGVTQEQLDTSFDWYGHNISYYMDVYDKTIEILEKRISETGNRIAAEAISIAGDSVDVWTNAHFLVVNSLSPSQYVTFSLNRDQNWESGDSYTWRAKFTNNAGSSTWGIMADYSDGSSEFNTTELSGDGWQEIQFVSDSTKTAERIYGYIKFEPKASSTLWADSIMLVRNRLAKDKYNRHYHQKRVVPLNKTDDSQKPVEDGDSTDVVAQADETHTRS